MSKIRVLMCPTDRAPYITNVENSLENMQRIVGGYIESVTLSHNPPVVLICNEEGRINGLPQNHSLPSPQIFGYALAEFDIHGNCFLCGASGEEFADLPEPRSQWLHSAKDMWKAWNEAGQEYKNCMILREGKA